MIRPRSSKASSSSLRLRTAAGYGCAPRQTFHNARSGYLRILYPYHPCFGQTFEVFGSAGGLRELVYVRMPSNATRGIPSAWMFDETISASIRRADRPVIDCQALLRLAQLLDLQVESRGIGRHESSNAQSKIASKAPSSPDDTGAGEVASKVKYQAAFEEGYARRPRYRSRQCFRSGTGHLLAGAR
jgi:hypothetical protein